MAEMETLDVRDLMLEAQAEIADIIREVQEELALPQMLNAISMQWMTLPDPLKERLRQEQPEVYRRMMEVVGDETPNHY